MNFTYITPRAHTYHEMSHRKTSLMNELIATCEPYVECGFDAHQIQVDLAMTNQYFSIRAINEAINIILGA